MKSINGTDWKIKKIPERLILKNKEYFNISYLLSNVFLDKKYTDEEIYNSIYKKQDKKLFFQNKDIINATDLLSNCIKNKKKILIFGDYDVDGYSSTYLLHDFFNKIDVNSEYFIPDRLLDGYGPNISLLKKLINKNNYELIIFVDCGSNSINEINYLENCGLKSIIIDHHQIYEYKKNSKNTVIINPLKNLYQKEYSSFCATTLVYFFVKYLVSFLKIEKEINLNKYLFFSAIATICDQMSLRGLNKSIVNIGLKNFGLNNFKNFNNLINTKYKLTSNEIGFSLGPILNSASRLGYPNMPIKLLNEKNKTNIDKISKKLIYLNERRKKIQTKTINLLKKNFNIIDTEVIFKYKENINEGLLGIIAANFVELYNRPSFILTNSSNLIKCSARSINGYDIGNIFYLAFKKKIIISGGGHSMAGGCVLNKTKLIQFKDFLNNIYKKNLEIIDNSKYYISEQNYDSLFSFAKNDLKYLEPIGNDNSNPFFLIKKNKIIKLKVIKDQHLHVVIKSKSSKSCVCFAFNAVGTNLGDLLTNYKKDIDLIVQINNKFLSKSTDFNLIIKDAIVH